MGSFLLFVLSEILPFIGPHHQGDAQTGGQRVTGLVHLLTFIIRSPWGRRHPGVQEVLRFTREIVAEQQIPESPEPNTPSPERPDRHNNPQRDASSPLSPRSSPPALRTPSPAFPLAASSSSSSSSSGVELEQVSSAKSDRIASRTRSALSEQLTPFAVADSSFKAVTKSKTI